MSSSRSVSSLVESLFSVLFEGNIVCGTLLHSSFSSYPSLYTFIVFMSTGFWVLYIRCCTVVVELASYLKLIFHCHYVIQMHIHGSRDWLVVAAFEFFHRWYVSIVRWQPLHQLNVYCACAPKLNGNRESIGGWKGPVMCPILLHDSSTSAGWPFVSQGGQFV